MRPVLDPEGRPVVQRLADGSLQPVLEPIREMFGISCEGSGTHDPINGLTKRVGVIYDSKTSEIWREEVTLKGTPLRAVVQAAGLCDDTGQAKALDLPTWAEAFFA